MKLLLEVELDDLSRCASHHTHDGAPEYGDDGSIVRALRVAKLEELLRKESPSDVLQMLTERDDLTESVDIKSVHVALVSYRQESTASDGTTIDAEVLLSIAETAKGLGVEALWLDAWCYRCGHVYVHAHFIRELHKVMSGVSAVVWLPRSKPNSSRGECEFCHPLSTNVTSRQPLPCHLIPYYPLLPRPMLSSPPC